MAQDSKRKRHARRLKRAATRALKMMEHALNERDVYRQMAVELVKERKLQEQAKEQESGLIKLPTMKQIAQVELSSEKA